MFFKVECQEESQEKEWVNGSIGFWHLIYFWIVYYNVKYNAMREIIYYATMHIDIWIWIPLNMNSDEYRLEWMHWKD